MRADRIMRFPLWIKLSEYSEKERGKKMKEKECIICGKTFKPKVSQQKCCSPQCTRVNQRNLARVTSSKNRKKYKAIKTESKQVQQTEKAQKKSEWKRVAAVMAKHPNMSYGQLVAKGIL